MDYNEAINQGLTIIVRRNVRKEVPFSNLKPKTRAIYILHLTRLPQRQIATLLHLSTRTIRRHITLGRSLYPLRIP